MTLPAHELAQQVLDAYGGQTARTSLGGTEPREVVLARRVVALEDALRRPRLIAIRQAAEWLDDEGAQTLASELHQLHEDLSRVLAGDGADQAGTA